ncbi:methyltransferase domain-containing protein [Arthrobacter sp. 92]|jgi:23S rRNA (guanine745-N1)-methyltransferase|uniref:methyltransferase domain-containing protein n=1 Tax=Arthrobacter sp. 92 TaxID=3418175 RepID=UPI0006A89C69|nr:putative 23S rRNA (guanine-N(1)-)-methyltransferase [Arthrobacter sp. Hiyo6]
MLTDAVRSLVCPVCRAGLAAGNGGGRLSCPEGHSFDAAKQGYFNFLVGKGTVFEADTAQMVAARFDFLSKGHYDPLALAVAKLAAPALTGPSPTVLDAGTGTGHYLRTLLATVPATAIGLDISKFALRRAARLNPGAVNIVSDIWQPLPVADAAVDVVTVVFAPRNAAEFARVLRPGGLLTVVTPRPGHLAAIAGQTGMLGIEPDKEERLASSLHGQFTAKSTLDLDLDLDLTATDVGNLAMMGPAGHHLDPAQLLSVLAGLAPTTHVSARFRISVFEPRRAPAV